MPKPTCQEYCDDPRSWPAVRMYERFELSSRRDDSQDAAEHDGPASHASLFALVLSMYRRRTLPRRVISSRAMEWSGQ